jgi:hypothetical protein
VGAQLGECFGGDRVVDQIVEKGEKLLAGHLATPFFLWK